MNWLTYLIAKQEDFETLIQIFTVTQIVKVCSNLIQWCVYAAVYHVH